MITVNVRPTMMGVATPSGRVTLRQGLNLIEDKQVEEELLKRLKEGDVSFEVVKDEPKKETLATKKEESKPKKEEEKK